MKSVHGYRLATSFAQDDLFAGTKPGFVLLVFPQIEDCVARMLLIALGVWLTAVSLSLSQHMVAKRAFPVQAGCPIT